MPCARGIGAFRVDSDYILTEARATNGHLFEEHITRRIPEGWGDACKIPIKGESEESGGRGADLINMRNELLVIGTGHTLVSGGQIPGAEIGGAFALINCADGCVKASLCFLLHTSLPLRLALESASSSSSHCPWARCDLSILFNFASSRHNGSGGEPMSQPHGLLGACRVLH